MDDEEHDELDCVDQAFITDVQRRIIKIRLQTYEDIKKCERVGVTLYIERSIEEDFNTFFEVQS